MSCRQINTWQEGRKSPTAGTLSLDYNQPYGQRWATAAFYASVIAWRETEINDWIAARIAERREG